MEINKDNSVISIFGLRGVGKTFFVSSRLKIRNATAIIYVDCVGAVSDYLKDAYTIVQVKTPASIDRIRKLLFDLKEKYIIFNLVYLTSKEKILFANNLSNALLSSNKEPSLTIIIDESAELLPQDKAGGYAYDLERLIRIGRNKGIKHVILTTQRLQKVDKNAIALSDYYVVFRINHFLDLTMLNELLGLEKKEFTELENKIKTLKVGEYMLFDAVEQTKKFFDANDKEIKLNQTKLNEYEQKEKQEQTKQNPRIKKDTKRNKIIEELTTNKEKINNLSKKERKEYYLELAKKYNTKLSYIYKIGWDIKNDNANHMHLEEKNK
jgi:hypothetical protein